MKGSRVSYPKSRITEIDCPMCQKPLEKEILHTALYINKDSGYKRALSVIKCPHCDDKVTIAWQYDVYPILVREWVEGDKRSTHNIKKSEKGKRKPPEK
jgi:endogenous inhibitor of DNA gyrase (YacG/DUF329 family)